MFSRLQIRLGVLTALMVLIAPAMAGGLGSEVVSDAAAIYEERMLTYLMSEYSRRDAVQEDLVEVLRVSPYPVGDILLVRVEARIGDFEKTAVAYFRAGDLSFVADRAPTYYEASGGKIGFGLREELLSQPGAESYPVIISFEAPPAFLLADEVFDPKAIDSEVARDLGADIHALSETAKQRPLTAEEEERYLSLVSLAQGRHNIEILQEFLSQRQAELQELPGVTSVSVSPTPGSAYLAATVAKESLITIASRPDVLSIETNRMEQISTLLDQSRIATGAKQLNDLGYTGTNRRVAVFDTGINEITINGQNCLPLSGSGSWAPNEPGTADT